MDKLSYEKKYLEQGYKYIAGVDEVGRGPLAGPVTTACVIMPLNEEDIIPGIDDSKKLTEKKREALYSLILQKAIAYKITCISPQKIDQINILEATKLCMKQSVEGLDVKPDVVLVDALKLDVDVMQESIIKGDANSYSIGCASIIAKVFRDRLMADYDKQYPGYGFAKHKGYGTKAHIDYIKEVGPCEIHRRTFIKNFWEEKEKV